MKLKLKDRIKNAMRTFLNFNGSKNNGKTAALLVLFIILSGISYNIFIAKTLPIMSFFSRGKTVAIDPGHGTVDKGVVHRESGVAESPINLSVSLKLKQILSRQKYAVVLTRDAETQELIGNREELKRRIDIATSNNADIYVSLHVNQYPDPSCFGAQCFYNPQKPESQLLALLIQEELKALEPENFREALPQDLFILREAPMPAVLVEMGFISNPQDRQKLQDPSYQEKIAKAIAEGINRYFKKDKPKHIPEYN